MSVFTKHLLLLIEHLSSRRMHIDFPTSSSVLSTFFCVASFFWTPRIGLQFLVSEEMLRIGIGILRLLLWSLAEVGMKIDDTKRTFTEKPCRSRCLSLVPDTAVFPLGSKTVALFLRINVMLLVVSLLSKSLPDVSVTAWAKKGSKRRNLLVQL